MKLYYNNDKCPNCQELTDHYLGKWCRTCHKARQKEWNKMHAEEKKAYGREWYRAHIEEKKAYAKGYQKSHAKEQEEYKKAECNSTGKALRYVRTASRQYLFKTLKHNKLPDYEIHHCWTYEDYTKFVYIPKSLHLKIHQYLRDNNIYAKTDHYKDIVQLINECTEYTYIHV